MVAKRVALNVLYVLVVAPAGLATRLFRDPLRLRRRDDRSNWVVPDVPPPTMVRAKELR